MSAQQTQPSTVVLSNLYSELQKFILVGDYDKIIKTCNKIIHIDVNQMKAHLCKLVAFIQNGKFNEAINAVHHAKLNDKFSFEIAYCYYRLNKLNEALKILDDTASSANDTRLIELRAQIMYRLERYTECKTLYEQLMKSTHDEYEDERETNYSAVIASLVIQKNGEYIGDLPQMRQHTYELCYNYACQLIAQENYLEAEKLLKKCEVLLTEQLDDDENEEDIDSEVGIIRVQLGYCFQMQGREQEALALYQRVLKNRPDDFALLGVAANNCVVINRTHNVFDSKKKMKIAISDSVDAKLYSYQREIIAANSVLFNIINAIGNYKAHCDALLKKYPKLEYVATLGMALGKAREGKESEAIDILLKYAENNPSLKVYLLAAQIALMKDDRDKCLDILLKCGDSKYLPGMVGSIVSLYLGKNMREQASKYLDETVDWYRQNRSEKSSNLEKMYREAADFHMRNDDPVAAAKCLEEILVLHPDSEQVIAQLVMAYAEIKSPKAKILSDRLPPISTCGLDIDELESANWMMGLKSIRSRTNAISNTTSSYSSIISSSTSATTTYSSMLTGFSSSATTFDTPPATPRDEYNNKQKKKRHGKLPKNYVEGDLPDLERWLPKYERTGFRRKRDRRGKDIIKGSQGSSTALFENYDYSNCTTLDTTGSESSLITTSTDSSSHSSQSSRNHKKKRRR